MLITLHTDRLRAVLAAGHVPSRTESALVNPHLFYGGSASDRAINKSSGRHPRHDLRRKLELVGAAPRDNLSRIRAGFAALPHVAHLMRRSRQSLGFSINRPSRVQIMPAGTSLVTAA